MSADRRPNRFGRRLTLGIAAVLAVGLSYAVGVGVQALVAVVGVLGVSWAVACPDGASAGRRAATSIATVCGLGMLALGIGYTYPPVQTAVVGTGALAVLALGVSLGARSLTESRFPDVLQSSVLALVLVVALSLLTNPAALAVVADGAVALWNVATSTPFVALVSLQVAAVALLLALPPTTRTLERWLPERESVHSHRLSEMGMTVADVRSAPRLLVVGFVAEVYVAMLAPGLLDWVLAQLSVLGGVITAVLESGVVLAVLLFPLGVCGVVLVGRQIQRFAVGVGDEDPTGTAADAAGGLVVPLVGAAWLLTLPSASVTPVAPLLGGFGAIGLVALVMIVVLLGVFVAWDFVTLRDGPGLVPLSGHGLAAGLFGLAVLVVAEQSAPAILVFAGFAGILLVWDGGEYAATLGAELPSVDGRQGVLAHTTASVLVGVVGVTVAMLTVFVVGPAASVPSGAGTVALALALVAIVALVATEA
ncbi:hypothetical protein ACFPYI_06765 [Halomarina salina]|uniref:Uncharacterized protein n=1 Tax=Halomarina salina TaxID=1872699 RepID=A0ABD5RKC0_9EURY|nr:hypothetical protein [Halomarina salina]